MRDLRYSRIAFCNDFDINRKLVALLNNAGTFSLVMLDHEGSLLNSLVFGDG